MQVLLTAAEEASEISWPDVVALLGAFAFFGFIIWLILR